MNILIIGLGSIARKHLVALRQQDEEFRIYALRSKPGSSVINGVINIYALGELNGIHLDFVIVSNPTAVHIPAIHAALAFHCPLFIEKPVYHTLEIEETLQRIKELEIVTYVACNLRFLKCLDFVKRELDRGSRRINEVNVYCGSYLPEWRPGTDFRKIYSANAELGGGVHIDLIHELDYLYWFFGMPGKVRALRKSQSGLCINACDYANYVLDYSTFCANVVLNYYRRDPKRTLELVFEDETWSVDLRANTVLSGERVLFSSPQTILDTYTDQLSYFIQLLKNGNKRSFNSINDAYNVLKICLENDDTQR
jgi:predicted dehydrogenase